MELGKQTLLEDEVLNPFSFLCEHNEEMHG